MKLAKIPLAIQLVVAVALGCAVGSILGPKAEGLGEISDVIIKLLKALATPLVFFAITDAFCHTEIPAYKGAKLLVISAVNAVVAIVIALSLSHLLPIGKWVSLDQLNHAIAAPTAPALAAPKAVDLSAKGFIETFVPGNMIDPFLGNNVVAVVFLSVLLGMAIRSLKNQRKMADELQALEKIITVGFALISKIMGWIVHLIPLVAFAIVAKMVGLAGFSIFFALGAFVLVVILGFVIHVFFYYSLLLIFWAKKSPRDFFKQGQEVFLTALSVGSSLATLPVTLRTLQDKMKVSPASTRLAACVGTNLNHDGILLYEAVAALFIATIQGIHLTLGQQAVVALTSLFAAVGIAGVPEAGFITLSLVVGSVGLPLTAVPLVLPVDWILGRLRATVNVTSDMIVAHLLDRS